MNSLDDLQTWPVRPSGNHDVPGLQVGRGVDGSGDHERTRT